MDLANIIQTSMDGSFSSGVTTTSQSIAPQTSSETIIIKPNDQRLTIPISSSNIAGSTTIQLPSSTSTLKEQSIILPPNFNASGGPLLCQLDDNSYILIDGLDQLTTTTTNSPTKTITATSVSSTLPSTNVIQTGNSPTFSVTLKPSTTGAGKSTPTVTDTSAVRKITSPQTTSIKSPTLVTKPTTTQGTTRPTFYIMSNSPITSKTSGSLSTKDSSPLVIANQSVKQITNTSTTSSKPYTNIITSTSVGQNSNTPVKYILVPQSKGTPVRASNIISNTGMKTITLNSQTLNLPVGTSLIPTNKAINNNNPGIIGNPGSKIIPPSKINLKVPPQHSSLTGKIQSSSIGVRKASETTSISKLFDEITSSEADSDLQDLTINEEPKSPTLFDMTVDDINETINPEPTKTIITYSKTRPKVAIKQLTKPNEIITMRTTPSNIMSTTTNEEAKKSLDSQPVKLALVNPPTTSTLPSLPMQFIVPAKSGKAPPATTSNRKRKPDMKSVIDAKKKKEEPPVVADSLQTKSPEAGCMIREVIASRNIQATDKAIISTAIHELKKLFARRELVLKQLNSSCVALGKVEYKLTISGSPVNIQEMYSRLTTFQEQYETDLKRLDWAVNAMHKLYSELAPKDEMRTTEEIIQDLIGPAEGVPDDPSAKYEKFKVSSPPVKKVTSPKPRSPKKPAKTFYYKGEDGCPTNILEERKVPDTPNPQDGKFHCEMCSKIFLKQISLAKHLEFDHPVSLELDKKSKSPRSPKLPHACSDCDKSFHSNIMLLIHRSNEHDGPDSYQLSRESKTKRSASDSRLFSDAEMKSPSEDESKPKKNKPNTMATRSTRSVRRVKKAVRRTPRTNTNNNKTKSKLIDSLDFLCDSDATLSMSPKHNNRPNWREVDLFDPDIPIECTDDNPIIPIKPLSEEVIAAYTYSSRHH